MSVLQLDLRGLYSRWNNECVCFPSPCCRLSHGAGHVGLCGLMLKFVYAAWLFLLCNGDVLAQIRNYTCKRGIYLHVPCFDSYVFSLFFTYYGAYM